ncbi:uncharacterized protein LOC117221757 isoform X8 [Megalopta genalis]|uniref:uncharacterized protein LOC117221757 isoform X8 n=1 Tax=Megalopta genalis TaxID=115081 RepID=UPI003FD3DAFB
MARKVRKASPKASPTIEEGKGDGVADGEEPVENIRQKMIKDMQEEIRLEQYNQMQCKQQEEQQLKKYETQLGETRAVLDRHWTAFVEDARNLQEQENVVGQVHDLRRTPGSRLVVRPEHVPLRLDDGEQGREHGHGYGNLQRDHRRRCTSSRKTEIENQKIVCISRFLTVDGQAAEDRPVLRQLFQEARRRIRIDREGATHQTSELDRPRLLPIAAQHRGEHDEGGHEDDQICARVRPDGVLRVGADRSACRHETDHGQGQVHLTLFAVRVLPLHGRSIVFGAHRKAIEVAFDEIKLTVKLPVDLDCHRMAIRGLWLAYDHYSVETESRRVPDLPAELRNSWDKPPDLLEFARTEYREKLRIWEEQAEERRLRLDEKKTILEKIENPPALPSARRGGKRGKKQKRPKSAKNNASEFEQTLDRFLPTDGELLPYLPTPNEVVRQREEENRKEETYSRATRTVHEISSGTAEGTAVRRVLETVRASAAGAGLRENAGGDRGRDEGSRDRDGVAALDHGAVTGHGFLVRAAAGSALDTREEGLVDERHPRHQVQRGEADDRVQKRETGRPRPGREQVRESAVSELGIEAGGAEERSEFWRGCSERYRRHHSSRIRGQRGSRVPELVRGRLIDAFEADARRVSRTGHADRANAANRL